MNGQKKHSVRAAILLAGTLLIASASAATAGPNDGMSFRDFRDQNPAMDRHSARALFRESYGGTGRNRADALKINPADIAAQIQSSRSDTGANNNLNNHALIRQFSTRTRQLDANGEIVRRRGGLNLDLTSNAKNITLGRNLFSGDNASIEISIGGETKSLSAGNQVTAAEYIAVKQALSGAGQKLVIDRSGRAIGGDVDLDAITGPQDAMRAANFVVANNVTTSGDFSKRSDFRLLGNLDNFGTVLASSSGSARSGSIHADDINNYVGAKIGSTVDLTLDAARNFNNAGTITSTGNLTINAGNAVTNYGSISSSGDLGVVSPALNNRGTLNSTNGNVNLNATDSTLTVDNRNGIISASNGAINLRDAAYTGSQNSVIVGGDLLSKQFNMNAGEGVATVDVNKLTGVVSQTGSAAHLTASTDLLQIGESCLTGDPTYFNTAGSIVINGNITVGENLVIVASGNITNTGGVTIRAGDATTTGFDITLIAGADFTNSSGENRDILPGDNSGAGAVSLTGKASRTGGSISLNGGASIIAQATTPGADANGGNVSLFAFDGSRPVGNLQPGVIDLASASITTGGAGTGTNGNVIIVGAQDKPTSFAVRTGTIDTTGGSTATGNITISSAKIAVSERGQPVTYDANGVRGSAFLTSGGLNIKAPVFLNSNIDSGNRIQVTSGNLLTIQNAVTAAGEINLFSGDNIQGIGVLNAGTGMVLSATGNIGMSGNELLVTTPFLEITAGGTGVNIDFNGVATTTTLTSIDAAKANVVLFGLGQNFASTGPIEAKNFSVTGSGLGTFGDVKARNANFSALTASIDNTSFTGTMDVETLGLFAAAGSIGSAGTPIEIGPKVEIVTAQSNNGDVYLNTTSKHRTIFLETRAAGSIGITAADSILMVGVGALNTSGSVDVTAGDGYLTVQQAITANGQISLSNTDLKGGKLSVLEDIATNFNNNISISLGSPSAVTMPTPSNVTVTGNVTLTGAVLKAEPGTALTGTAPAFVIINNGGKANALVLGDKQSGGITIHANQ